VEQAGHFYSGGHHAGLRFNPDNVTGQCVRCNHFLSGNLIHYRQGLVKRIGEARVEDLDNIAAYFKRTGYKWSRIMLIEVILKYKALAKSEKSCKSKKSEKSCKSKTLDFLTHQTKTI
jgi:hypothetical protein